MSRKKLKHILAIESMENVRTDGQLSESPLKGRWQDFFGNKSPIFLELACGRGYYTLALGRRFSDRNIIGIDKKGCRLWGGADEALKEGLDNVAFLRGYIEKLDEYFGENEVDEIWITFPDPFPKPSKESKRLTSKRFLDMYKKLVKPGGMVHFKTDNLELFEYSLGEIESEKFLVLDVNRDVHRNLKEGSLLGVRTYYENKFIQEGKKINYIKFQV